MKAFSLSLALLFLSLVAAHGQEKPWKKEKMNIMGTSYPGFSIPLSYGEHKSRMYLTTYLKERGKISEKRSFIEVKETSWKTKEDPGKVYALVAGDSTQSRIWLGYSPELKEESILALEKEMGSMPFFMDKYHLQFQIKEAEDAATFLSREIKNSEKEEARLKARLEQNAQEKIRLEQALEQNATDKIQIGEELVSNSKTREDKVKGLEEVKKQLENLKVRLRKL